MRERSWRGGAAWSLVAAAALLTFTIWLGARPFAAHAEDIVLVVTSPGDPEDTSGSECPSDDACTLREAITVANDDAGGDAVIIQFDPDVFPVAEPSTVAVQGSPLPPITRPAVTVDGRGAGVLLDGALLAPGADTVGLALAGTGNRAYGLTVRSFPAACIVASGESVVLGGPAPADRNALDDCGTGVFVSGPNVDVAGNVIGLQPADETVDVMSVGIVVTADGATIGMPSPEFDQGNVIGNVPTGIQAGLGSGVAFSGTTIHGNRIGITIGGIPVPVTTAIRIDHPSDGSVVTANLIAHAATGIAVAADDNGESTLENDLRGNHYESLGGLAIDLLADGIRNPNDPGDGDSGPNGLLNFPAFTEVSQARIFGTACAGCVVEIYTVEHVPGDAFDHPLIPLTGGTVTAGPSGTFTISNPLVSVDSWVMATATDQEGNTSEFSRAERVGAGIVQCGNVQLQPGWNLVGYFGQPELLGGDLPGDEVSAVHRLVPGTSNFASWFPSAAMGLTSLSTGEPYWFFATEPRQLPGGISLTTALPIALAEGWNEFVYVGGTANVLDALGSIDGSWDALYRYDNTGAAGPGWRSYGSPDAPAYVHAFETLHACTAYRIHMTEPATLVPLRP